MKHDSMGAMIYSFGIEVEFVVVFQGQILFHLNMLQQGMPKRLKDTLVLKDLRKDTFETVPMKRLYFYILNQLCCLAMFC